MSKMSKTEARRRLTAAGVDWRSNPHILRASEMDEVREVAKAYGYRKRKDAPGSTGRMFLQFLQRRP